MAVRSSPRRRCRSCRRRRGVARRSAPRCRASAAPPSGRGAPGRRAPQRRSPGDVRSGRGRRPHPRPAPGAPLGERQDGPGRAGPRPGRAPLRARVDGRHGAGAARRRPAGHRCRRGHRVPGDARRAREDARSAYPRGASWPIAACRPSRGAARRRDRPVRARRRQPVPVRGGVSPTGHHVRRAGRGDRHRWAVDGPGGGQEPRERGHRHLTRAVRARPRGAGRARWAGRSAPRRAGRRGVPPHRGVRRADRGRAAGTHGRRGRRRSLPRPPDDQPREGRHAALRRESASAGRPLSTGRPGADRRGRPLRDRSAATPGQAVVVQQRARRLGRRRPGPPAGRPVASS